MEIIPEESHKSPYVLHIICFPRLMTNLWRKVLRKDSDFIFNTPTWLSVWPNTCREPFCIAIIIPVIRRIIWKGPWVVRGSELSAALMKSLERGFKVEVGKRPHGPPFRGRELLQIQEDPVKWGGGWVGAIFCCVQGAFPPCPKSWCRTCYFPHPLDWLPKGENGGGRWIVVWGSGGRRGKTFLRWKKWRPPNGDTFPVWNVPHMEHWGK